MPGNGYPMRLLLPGYEGNMNIKFLRRIQVTDQPAMTFYECATTRRLLPDGKDYQFYFVQRGEILHHPAVIRPRAQRAGLLRDLRHRLFRQWPHRKSSGLGRRRQELGRSRAGRAGLPKAFTRFRMPWRWDGQPAVLQSRAWDEAGNAQPTREQFVAKRGQT